MASSVKKIKAAHEMAKANYEDAKNALKYAKDNYKKSQAEKLDDAWEVYQEAINKYITTCRKYNKIKLDRIQDEDEEEK